MKYDVQYELDGKKKQVTYRDCKDAGMAFAWCQQEFPGCKVLHAIAYGKHGDPGEMHHDPPPVQRDPVKEPGKWRAPKRTEKDGMMPFYDSAISHKPFSES